MTRKHKETKKDDHSDAEKLEATIEQLQKEKEEIFGQLQRVSADYANYQKRVPKQIADSVAYQKELLIKSLLPLLDNLEHTLVNAASAHNVDVLAKGTKITYDQLLDILKSHQVEQIAAAGEAFDPAKHEAIMRKSQPDRQDNIVLEELQKGYMLNGRALRPSRVVVNKLAPQEPAAPTETAEMQQPAGADKGAEQGDEE